MFSNRFSENGMFSYVVGRENVVSPLSKTTKWMAFGMIHCEGFSTTGQSLVDRICHGLLGCSPGRPSLFPAYSTQTSLLTQPSVRGDSSGIKPSFSQLKLLLLMLHRPKQGAFIVYHCMILNHFHVFVQWKDKQKQMLIIRNPTPRAVTRYLSNHSCSLILRGKSG